MLNSVIYKYSITYFVHLDYLQDWKGEKRTKKWYLDEGWLSECGFGS